MHFVWSPRLGFFKSPCNMCWRKCSRHQAMKHWVYLSCQISTKTSVLLSSRTCFLYSFATLILEMQIYRGQDDWGSAEVPQTEKKTKWLEAALHNFCSLILALSACPLYLPPSLSSPFSLQRCKNQNKPRREIIRQGWSLPLIKATEIPLCAQQAESSLPAPGYGLFKEILSHHNLKEGYLTFLSFVSISSIGALCVSQNN